MYEKKVIEYLATHGHELIQTEAWSDLPKELTMVLNTDAGSFGSWLEKHTQMAYSEHFPSEHGWLCLQWACPTVKPNGTRGLEMAGILVTPSVDDKDTEVAFPLGAVVQFDLQSLAKDRLELKAEVRQPVVLGYFVGLLYDITKRWPEAMEPIQEYIDAVASRLGIELPKQDSKGLSQMGQDRPVEGSHLLAQFQDVPQAFTRYERDYQRFVQDHPNWDRNVFLMMRFREGEQYGQIHATLSKELERCGMEILRADDKEYSTDLWDNVCVYMLGCKYGIVVFEEIDEREFNPSIALELGFMLAHNKRCLILKDKRMGPVPTDIVGKLYKEFDTYNIEISLTACVQRWVQDIGLTGVSLKEKRTREIQLQFEKEMASLECELESQKEEAARSRDAVTFWKAQREYDRKVELVRKKRDLEVAAL